VARKYDLKVIEDATECLGAKYKGRKAGSLGNISCFSYNGNKIITTGGGGMIVTDNEEWAAKAKYLTTQAKDDPVEYIHNEIGYNYRLTNLLAAMGVAQMERLDEFVAAKRRISQTYSTGLHDVPGVQPVREAPWAWSTSWMYTVLVDPTEYGMGSRDLLLKLAESRIQARPLWQPMHASPAYGHLERRAFPIADRLYRNALSLPCSVGISQSELERVLHVICSCRAS
jgi:perosamine synthetase